MAVAAHLAPFLPSPQVVKNGDAYALDYARPQSIGMVRGFAGQFGMAVRAWAYIRSLGPDGLLRASQTAVLNANYLAARLRKLLPLPYNGYCMHEFVLSALRGGPGVRGLANKLAKRLLDYGFHAPTVYFPLIVQEALMIEPTETESLATLDAFCQAVQSILDELETHPQALEQAPHTTPVAKVDEVAAARRPVLRG